MQGGSGRGGFEHQRRDRCLLPTRGASPCHPEVRENSSDGFDAGHGRHHHDTDLGYDLGLAEVYDRVGQVNKDLWSNIRGTFYGYPNRSRAERFLDSGLLFWPLSYQIKSTKWLLRVLFDRAGGLQTNALGAVTLDRMAETHNRLLATDPSYRDWFEKHPTLVFVSQMLLPVSFDQVGVSLSPVLRGIFFDRDPLRAMEIGPVHTYNRVIRPLRTEVQVDQFPTVNDAGASLGLP